MFCYVDRYFVILFRLLHFLFQRDLVSFHWFLNMTSFRRNRYTQIMYIYIYIYIYKITDYIICVYAVYMLMYTYTYMYVYMCVCVYINICAVIPHTALLSHSELPQGKFLHRDSPSFAIGSSDFFSFSDDDFVYTDPEAYSPLTRLTAGPSDLDLLGWSAFLRAPASQQFRSRSLPPSGDYHVSL